MSFLGLPGLSKRSEPPRGTFSDFACRDLNLRLSIAQMPMSFACHNEPDCSAIPVRTEQGNIQFYLRPLKSPVSEAGISASNDQTPRYSYQALALKTLSVPGSYLVVDLACATRDVCVAQIGNLQTLRLQKVLTAGDV